MPTLSWGLIGASNIAAAQLIPALRRCGQRIEAVMSSDAERGAKYATEHDIPASTDQLDALLEHPDIDAVYVSTKNDVHAEQVMAAARAGKHILCEKPLSYGTTLGRLMIQATDRAGVVLGVNHHLVAAGTHTAIRRAVHSGVIGAPLAVHIQHATLLSPDQRGWRLGAGSGAGVVLDLTCHDASVTNAILGAPPLEVVAFAAHQGEWVATRPDTSVAVAHYRHEVLATFHDSFASAHTPTRMEVHGTDGSIVAENVMTADPGGTVTLRTGGVDSDVTVSDRRSPYDITLAAFCKAVKGDGAPIVDGRAGFDAMAVAVAVADAANNGVKAKVESL